MIYTINNIAYNYSKFIIRPPNLEKTSKHVLNKTFLNNRLQTSLTTYKQTLTFQSSELLMNSEDLTFLNLKCYFKNILKALHICVLARNNNQRIVFVDINKTPNLLKSDLINKNLLKQYGYDSLPRILEPRKGKSPRFINKYYKTQKNSIVNIKKNDGYNINNLTNFNNLTRFLKVPTSERIQNLKNALYTNEANASIYKVSHLANINSKTLIKDLSPLTFESKPKINTPAKFSKHALKAQAKFSILNSRNCISYACIENPGFFSNSKNVFNVSSNLTHLNNFKTQKASFDSNSQKSMLLKKPFFKTHLKSLLSPYLKDVYSNFELKSKTPYLDSKYSKKNPRGFLPYGQKQRFRYDHKAKVHKADMFYNFIRLQTKSLQEFKINGDNLNLKRTQFPLYDTKYPNVLEAAQKLNTNTKLNLGKKRLKPFLEYDLNIKNSYYKNQATMLNPYIVKYYSSKNDSKSLNVNFAALDLNLTCQSSQKPCADIIKNHLYKQSLNLSKNAWLAKADVIFFVDPQSCRHIVKQAKLLNIPTLGLISSNLVSTNGRASYRNFCLDDIVHYPILGNPSSLYFVISILELFIKTLSFSNKFCTQTQTQT